MLVSGAGYTRICECWFEMLEILVCVVLRCWTFSIFFGLSCWTFYFVFV